MSSIRSRVIDNIKTTLDTLNLVGGVFIWFPIDSPGATLPLAIIAAMDEQKMNSSSSVPFVACELHVTIDILAAQTDEMSGPGWNVVEDIIYRIEKALAIDPNRGLGAGAIGGVTDTLVTGISIKPFAATDTTLSGQVALTVNYRHLAGNPGAVS